MMKGNRYHEPLTMSMFRNAADLAGEALAQREAAADLIDQLDFERTALRAERDQLIIALEDILAYDGNGSGGLHDYAGFGSEGSFQSEALAQAIQRAHCIIRSVRGVA